MVGIAAARPLPEDAHERVRALHAVSRERRFEALVDRHERRLRRVIFGMLGDPNRVEDVLQETFLRAFRGLPRGFGDVRVESAWIYRIAHRCCLNELRSRRRRPETPGLPDDAWFASHEEAAAALDVAAALRALPVKSRAFVLLVDVVGLDYETAARVLRMPRGTVAWRLSVAREQFREALGDA